MSLVTHTTEQRFTHKAILLAGLAGATAEVLWVTLFCALTPLSGGEVLRQITASVFPTLSASAWAPALGLALHFTLGVAVAYAFGFLIWQAFARRMGTGITLAMAVLALTVIWTINFFVLLPVLNTEFVRLMPYTVTFGSKVLFGIAMAATLNSFELESHKDMIATAHTERTNPLQILY